MALLELYTSNETPNYTFSTTLDNITLFFEIKWNSKGNYWSLSLYDVNNVLLVAGLAIRLGCNILAQFSHKTELPQGELFAFNFAGNSEITFNNWGSDVLLMYNEAL